MIMVKLKNGDNGLKPPDRQRYPQIATDTTRPGKPVLIEREDLSIKIKF